MVVFNRNFIRLFSLKLFGINNNDFRPCYLDFSYDDKGTEILKVTETQTDRIVYTLTNLKLDKLEELKPSYSFGGKKMTKYRPWYKGIYNRPSSIANISGLGEFKIDAILDQEVKLSLEKIENEEDILEDQWEICVWPSPFYSGMRFLTTVLKTNEAPIGREFSKFTPDSYCLECKQLHTQCEYDHEEELELLKEEQLLSEENERHAFVNDKHSNEKDRNFFLNEGNIDYWRQQDNENLDRAFNGDD